MNASAGNYGIREIQVPRVEMVRLGYGLGSVLLSFHLHSLLLLSLCLTLSGVKGCEKRIGGKFGLVVYCSLSQQYFD